MGFSQHRHRQLASSHMVLTHARLPDLWSETMGTSFNERVVARGKYTFALCRVAKNDRRDLAQSCCGIAVWFASFESGIRGLGRRTQRCSGRIFLDADVAVLRALRRR